MLAYQHEKYIRHALNALVAQTCQSFKVVAIDDGSTDSTYSVLKEYEGGQLAGKMTVLTHPGHRNCGIYAGYRRCLRGLETEFFMPHASDDCLVPEAIGYLLRLMDSNPLADFAYGACKIIDANGSFGGCYDGESDLGEGLEALQSLLYCNPVREPTMFLRAKCSKVVTGDLSGVLYGDWLHNLVLFSAYRPLHYSRPVVNYRVHGDNISVGPAALAVFADRHREVLLASLFCRELVEDERRRLLILLSGSSIISSNLGWPTALAVAVRLVNASKSDVAAVIRVLNLSVPRPYPFLVALALSFRAVEVGMPSLVFLLLKSYWKLVRYFDGRRFLRR